MAAPRKPAQRDSDRAAIAEAYLRGVPQYQMAAALTIDPATVSRDLVWLHGVWRARFAEQIDAQKGRELAKIDALERTYWAAWERSCSERTRSKTGKTDAPSGKTDKEGRALPGVQRIAAEIVKEERDGNPAFLAGVQWCISERLKVMGGYAPTKIAPTDADGKTLPTTFLGLVQLATNGDRNH